MDRQDVDSEVPAAGPIDKTRRFPTSPGVYLMKDAQGRVVYIGKAKNLRAAPRPTFKKTPRTTHEFATGSPRSSTSIFSKPKARSTRS